MSGETKTLLGIGLATIIILAVGVFLVNKTSPIPNSDETVDAKLLIRSNSNKISAPNAKVTLVEFGDFQCPACASAHPIVKQILNDHKGKITFVFRNFPLTQHKNARIAAEAAEASGEQNNYWKMYD